MSDITVRVLTEDDWQLYRTFRLKSLAESPEAFAATHDDEAAFDASVWHERMLRATRLLAESGDDILAVASVRRLEDESEVDRPAAEFFGMWVDPAHRGKGVGARLVRAGTAIARSMGCEDLAYWVSTDNGAAVAFASSYGFRPTDSRRPMTVRGTSAPAAVDETDEGEEEMMMLLPLASTPGADGGY